MTAIHPIIHEEAEVKDLTIAEACKILSVSRNTMLTWINDGYIDADKSRGRTAPWLIPAEEVERVRLVRIADLQEQINEISQSVEEFLKESV